MSRVARSRGSPFNVVAMGSVFPADDPFRKEGAGNCGAGMEEEMWMPLAALIVGSDRRDASAGIVFFADGDNQSSRRRVVGGVRI